MECVRDERHQQQWGGLAEHAPLAKVVELAREAPRAGRCSVLHLSRVHRLGLLSHGDVLLPGGSHCDQQHTIRQGLPCYGAHLLDLFGRRLPSHHVGQIWAGERQRLVYRLPAGVHLLDRERLHLPRRGQGLLAGARAGTEGAGHRHRLPDRLPAGLLHGPGKPAQVHSRPSVPCWGVAAVRGVPHAGGGGGGREGGAGDLGQEHRPAASCRTVLCGGLRKSLHPPLRGDQRAGGAQRPVLLHDAGPGDAEPAGDLLRHGG
mmetsp:Transcript_38446/g.111093  ORF Transcript_38446/g.111093 Transcript_38446/m.111093 type:complete len:261 (+) Transcript_38446:631-1413(+)